jgi:hypothetical protein
MEKARARDLQTMNSLKAETWEAESVLQKGRHLLPLINIALRADLFPELYAPIFLSNLRPETASIVREVAAKLAADEGYPLDDILLKYLVDLNGRRRFLLTE